MFSKAISYGSVWDYAASESIVESQRWILSTMQKYGSELVTMLWRILGNEQDVCDAYQDTFLQLAHFEGGQKPKNVKAYIFRVANNVAVEINANSSAEVSIEKQVVRLTDYTFDSSQLTLDSPLRVRVRRWSLLLT